MGDSAEILERFGRPDAPPVLLLAGPTASGKSALALVLAARADGVIVNGDSMQVYRDLRILSARPTLEEEATVPHLLFGHVDGAVEWSVGQWLAEARETLTRCITARRPVIVTGGTGLYFRALTEGLVETPPVPVETVAAVRAIGPAPEHLHGWLAREAPAEAARLNPADRPRLERAIGVLLATGRTLTDWQKAPAAPPLAPGAWAGVFLAPDRAELVARIDRRFVTMMKAGALDEVRALLARGLPPNRGVMKAHGVPHLVRALASDMPMDEAIRRGQADTRAYAKRQMTWARRFMCDWLWTAPEEALRALGA